MSEDEKYKRLSGRGNHLINNKGWTFLEDDNSHAVKESDLLSTKVSGIKKYPSDEDMKWIRKLDKES